MHRWARARRALLPSCDLPQQWGQFDWRAADSCFNVLELDFGLGRNFLATWLAWDDHLRQAPQGSSGSLHYWACIAHPVRAGDLAQALIGTTSFSSDTRYPNFAQRLCAAFWGLTPGVHPLYLGPEAPKLHLLIGPALRSLQASRIAADAIYMDDLKPYGCSLELLQTLRAHSRLGASWIGSNASRRLQKSLTTEPPALARSVNPVARKPVLIVGAGLAGASCAAALVQRGWRVEVWERAEHIAAGASGIPVGLCVPRVHSQDNAMTQLLRTGLRCTFNTLHRLTEQGLLQALGDYALTTVQEREVSHQQQQVATQSAAHNPHYGDWSLPSAGRTVLHHAAAWIKPPALVRALLQHPDITLRCQTALQGPAHLAALAQSQQYAGIVLANGFDAAQCHPQALPDLQAIRGQTSWAPHSNISAATLRHLGPMNGHGYFVPWVPSERHGQDASHAFWICGSSYIRKDTATDIRPREHETNAAKLRTLAPELWPAVAPFFADGAKQLRAWSGIRCYSRTRLPLVGRLGLSEVYVCTGLASRGLTLGPLCGELLAAQITPFASNWPLPAETIALLQP